MAWDSRPRLGGGCCRGFWGDKGITSLSPSPLPPLSSRLLSSLLSPSSLPPLLSFLYLSEHGHHLGSKEIQGESSGPPISPRLSHRTGLGIGTFAPGLGWGWGQHLY